MWFEFVGWGVGIGEVGVVCVCGEGWCTDIVRYVINGIEWRV